MYIQPQKAQCIPAGQARVKTTKLAKASRLQLWKRDRAILDDEDGRPVVRADG